MLLALSWPLSSSLIRLGSFKSYTNTRPPVCAPTAIVCPSEQKLMHDNCTPVGIYLTSFPSTMSKKCIFSSSPTEHISILFTGENAIPVHAWLCKANLDFITFEWMSQSATTPLRYPIARLLFCVGLNFVYVIGALIDLSLTTIDYSFSDRMMSVPSEAPAASKLSF